MIFLPLTVAATVLSGDSVLEPQPATISAANITAASIAKLVCLLFTLVSTPSVNSTQSFRIR
jgi:hypothetical protein